MNMADHPSLDGIRQRVPRSLNSFVYARTQTGSPPQTGSLHPSQWRFCIVLLVALCTYRTGLAAPQPIPAGGVAKAASQASKARRFLVKAQPVKPGEPFKVHTGALATLKTGPIHRRAEPAPKPATWASTLLLPRSPILKAALGRMTTLRKATAAQPYSALTYQASQQAANGHVKATPVAQTRLLARLTVSSMTRTQPNRIQSRVTKRRKKRATNLAMAHVVASPAPSAGESDGPAPVLTHLHVINPSRAWLTPGKPLDEVAVRRANRSAQPYATIHTIADEKDQTGTASTKDAARADKPAPANSKEVAVAQLPAAKTPPPVSIPGLPTAEKPLPLWVSPNSKVIRVDSLKLPALSQPLSAEQRAASVPADTPYISSVSPSLPGGSTSLLAQNPAAPALRQPNRPVTSSDRLPNQIEVAVSTFVVLLTTEDLQTVAIADPAIADVAVVNAHSVLVNGKVPGITSLVVVDRAKIRQYQVRVVPQVGTRGPDIAAAIGIQGVSVRMVRDAIVLEGEVANTEEVRRAVEIGGIYSPKVINYLTVRPAPVPQPGAQDAALASEIQTVLTTNVPGITASVAGDVVFLQGTMTSQDQSATAEKIATAIAKGKTVVNLLKPPPFTVEQARQAIGGVAGGATGTGASGTGATGTGATGTGVTAPVTINPSIGTLAPPPSPRNIIVTQAGDSIILEGTAASAADATLAATIAARTGLPVVNRLTVAAAPTAEAGLLQSIALAINQPGVTVTGSAKRLILQGSVRDTNAALAAEQIARSFAAEVDNMLVTPNPMLIDVDISIMEINRTNLRNLGIQFPSLLDASPTGFIFGQIPFDQSPNPESNPLGVNPFRPGNRAGPSGPFSLNSVTPFQASLRAMVDRGDARLLSSPRTTVLSGRTATFQVGGQVPIPQSTTINAAGSTVGIVFKDFGILMDVIPIASPDGVITMRLRTEVSQPDFTIGVAPPGGGIIPGFTRRAANTELTLQSRSTIAVAGMIQNNVTGLVRKLPILSSIPVLGALFTSRRFQRNETELVIFVTPRLMPNALPAGMQAQTSVVAVGPNTSAATTLGNPGIPSFNSGGAFSGAGAAGGSTGGLGGGTSGSG